MENKKDLGKLFKAKLDGLEKSPNENLWAAINEELQDKKKKRRVIPFYFYYAGVALLLLFIGFATKSFWMPAFQNFNSIENSSTLNDRNSNAVDGDEQNEIVNQQSISTTKDGSSTYIESGISSDNADISGESSEVSSNNESEDGIQNSSSTNNQKSSGKSLNVSAKGSSQSTLKSNSEATAKSRSENRSTKNSTESKIATTISSKSNNSVSGSNIRHYNIDENEISSTKSDVYKETISDDLKNFNNQKIAETDSNSCNNSSKSTSSEKSDSLESDTETIANFNRTNAEVLKENDSLKVDSIAIKRKAKTELRLAAQKKLDSIEATKPKYYVFAHADVSAFNNFGKQSFIDSRLDNYDTTTELQYNYGIYFGFIANDKLNIRIGLNKSSLSLTTKNVPLISQNPNTAISGYFSNLDYNTSLSNEQLAEYFDVSDVTLTQNIRFIEIPLEAKYKVYDGTIGIEAIGGISTLFLSKNEVKAEANNKFLYLGKVNNGLQASASLNLGAGLSYKIGKNLQLNVEPMFKYYFRSFEVTNKPYSLNFQVGLQINFSELFKK